MTDPAAHAAHSPVPPAPAAPQGSVLWTCAGTDMGTDCEWTATNLLPEAARMSSYAQHLVAALAVTAPTAATTSSASSSVVDAALLARAEQLQAELDATRAELEHARGMMRPMAAYLAAGFASAGATTDPSSHQEPAAPSHTTSASSGPGDQSRTKSHEGLSKDAAAGEPAEAPSVSDMLDIVDGVVRTAADVVDTAWPILSKVLRGATR